MPRLFTNDATTNDAVVVTAQGFNAYTFGTMAAVIRPTNFSGVRMWLMLGLPAEDRAELYTNEIARAGEMSAFYNGQTSVHSTGVVATAGNWTIICATKATGTVAPRYHIFNWPTGVWAHGAMSGTLANASGTSTTFGPGFNSAPDGQYSPHGGEAAGAIWQGHVMTDSEVERLPGGRWSQMGPNGPSLLIEFDPRRSDLTRTTIDCSRNRMRQASSGSQVTRDNAAGPPGFRYSVLNRRR